MKRPETRTLIYAAIGLLIVVVIVMSLLPDPIEVDTAVAERGPMRVTIDEKGETRVRDRFTVTAPVAGELRRIDLREGDRVAEGDVVAVIEPLPLDQRKQKEIAAQVAGAESAVGEARAMVSGAESALSLAVSERRRMAALASEGVVSAEDLERAETAEATAREELEAARDRERVAVAQFEAARAGLISGRSPGGTGLIEVRSPVEGEVFAVPDRSGRVVQPGERLLEISNARQIEVVIEMLSKEAVKVAPGDPVIIEDWGGPESLKGTVRTVEPSGFTKISALGIEEQRVNVVVDLAEVPSSLGDGYRVEARVLIWSAEDALQVPISTLFRKNDQWALFVVEGDTVAVRDVKIGHQTDLTAEVVSGLEEGDVVVLHPSNALSEGASVTER